MQGNEMVAPGEPDQRIDYVWVTPEFYPKRCERVFDSHPLVSDHYGILADLSMTPE